MKHEIGILKLNVISMTSLRQERDDINSAIGVLKEEIKEIKTANVKIESKIKSFEEELEEESEDDLEEYDESKEDYAWQTKNERIYSCQYCDIQIKTRNNFEVHMESHIKKGSKEQLKCSECEYSCNKKITLKKHKNTKQQITNETLGNTESESEGEFDLFQLEIVSDEEVYVCNLCDEGLDSEPEVRKHLKVNNKKVFELHKEKNILV